MQLKQYITKKMANTARVFIVLLIEVSIGFLLGRTM
jgi:hypothetical protein